MNENKKLNVDLKINIIKSSSDSKDLFLMDSTEIINDKLLFKNKDNELFIINYINQNSEEIIDIVPKTNMIKILRIFSKAKIILYIKFNEISNSFTLFNSYKYQKLKNLYRAENCERI